MDLPPSFMCKIFILLTFALHVWANVCIFFYPCCLQETVRIEQNPWWINSENEAMLHSPLSFAFKLKMMNTLESREKWLVLFRIQKPSPSLSLEDIQWTSFSLSCLPLSFLFPILLRHLLFFFTLLTCFPFPSVW